MESQDSREVGESSSSGGRIGSSLTFLYKTGRLYCGIANWQFVKQITPRHLSNGRFFLAALSDFSYPAGMTSAFELCFQKSIHDGQGFFFRDEPDG